jgi:squalene-associated FAD-dependent desaturase
MNVAIIGSGLAGLACGCELADRGHRVTLFERRPWAGGKAYSFVDAETGQTIDNGQHIFMRCTTAYIDLLTRLGTLPRTRMQERLRVPVLDADGRVAVIAASPLPAPMHLLPSFAGYAHLPVLERARVAQAAATIARMSPAERDGFDDDRTFADWLRSRGQSETSISEFWDLIVVPTLNCRSERASAAQALFVLQEGFLASSGSAAVGLPLDGLSELHVVPAIGYIERRGGDLRLRAAVGTVGLESDGRVALRLGDGTSERFDACVIALPPAQAIAVVPPAWRSMPPFDALSRFETSPIINVHLWFDGSVADFEFAAFTGCELQWCFNRTRIAGKSGAGEEHLVLSLSAADAFIELEKGELLERLLPQLERVLPQTRARRLRRSVVIKETDATFVPSPGLRRPGNGTFVPNVAIAGAYTDTGWPATMESAVRSGLAAARAIAPYACGQERAPALAV